MTEKLTRCLCATLFAVLLVRATESPAGAREPIEEPVFLPRSVLADPDGALSLSGNAAGLSTARSLEVQGAFSLGARNSTGAGRKGAGLYAVLPVAGAALGYAFEGGGAGGMRDAWLQRHTFALSLGPLGLATRMWSHDRDMPAARTGEASWLWRLGHHLSMGAHGVLANDRARDIGVPDRLDAGVALRPWRADHLTLAIEGGYAWLRTEATRAASSSDGRAGVGEVGGSALVRLTRGLYLGADGRARLPASAAGGEPSFRASVVLRVSSGVLGYDLGVRAGEAGRAGDDDATLSMAIRASMDRYPSVIDHRPRGVIVPLRGALEEGALSGAPFGRLALRLERLSRAPEAVTIVLRDDGFKPNWAQVEELRTAIGVLRKAGKKVVYMAEGYGPRAYAIAAACDHIIAMPGGHVGLRGLSSTVTFYKRTLELLGVEVQSVRFGEHKTAPEVYTEEKLSEAWRARLEAIVEARWKRLVGWITADRKIAEGVLLAKLTEGVVYPQDARAAGLVDAVLHRDEVEKHLRDKKLLPAGAPLPKEALLAAPERRWGRAPRVDVVTLDAQIADGKSGRSVLGGRTSGSEDFDAIVSRVERGAASAIVVRIDSPGGSVTASERMWRAIRRTNQRKPVVVSMGAVAASGGYYAAVASPRIYADAGTVTGSIGIFAAKPSAAGLWKKLGLGRDAVERGPHASIDSLDRPWTEAERITVERNLRRYYDLFLERVSDGRKKSLAELSPLAEGRVHLGADAKASGLVDEIGGLSAAIRDAATRAGVSADEAIEVRFLPEPTFLQSLQAKLGLLVAEPRTEGGGAVEALAGALGEWVDMDLISALVHAAPLAPMALDLGPR